jgi:hypothetical protein
LLGPKGRGRLGRDPLGDCEETSGLLVDTALLVAAAAAVEDSLDERELDERTDRVRRDVLTVRGEVDEGRVEAVSRRAPLVLSSIRSTGSTGSFSPRSYRSVNVATSDWMSAARPATFAMRVWAFADPHLDGSQPWVGTHVPPDVRVVRKHARPDSARDEVLAGEAAVPRYQAPVRVNLGSVEFRANAGIQPA